MLGLLGAGWWCAGQHAQAAKLGYRGPRFRATGAQGAECAPAQVVHAAAHRQRQVHQGASRTQRTGARGTQRLGALHEPLARRSQETADQAGLSWRPQYLGSDTGLAGAV